MHEVFTCILAVKAAHMEDDEKARFKVENRRYFRAVVKGLKLELFMNPIVEVAGGFVLIGFIVYSYTQEVTLTQIIALLAPAVIAYKPVKQLSKIATYIQRSMAAADRYFDLIDTVNDVNEIENPIVLSEFNKEIEFRNVKFSYSKDKNILDDVSFKIPKGKLIAVVGETGSGKTTIANLIARFYDVDSGEILIDGNNVIDVWYNDQQAEGETADITFIVDDSGNQTHTAFYLKGSWDSNGVYDSGWNGGAEHSAFYDDGTHGDSIAGDSVFTASFTLPIGFYAHEDTIRVVAYCSNRLVSVKNVVLNPNVIFE